MSDIQKIQQLASALTQLRDFTPQSKTDLKAWYEQARQMHEEILNPGGIAPEVPEFLWHYLSDADTRFKSKEYEKLQNVMMDKFISILKTGAMPKGSDLDVV